MLASPAPVVFAPNPVTGLDIVNDPETGVRLRLNVGTVTEDIMVYGQPPCSSGRMKRRRVYYLGLLGPATDGQCDLTDLYTARFGPPAPGKKVFIVTSQTRNGWKGVDSVFSAIVPPRAAGGEQQSNEETKPEAAATTATPTSDSAPRRASLDMKQNRIVRGDVDGQAFIDQLAGIQRLFDSIPAAAGQGCGGGFGERMRQLARVHDASGVQRVFVQVGQEHIRFAGAAVDRGSATAILQRDGLVPPVGEAIRRKIARRLENGDRLGDLRQSRPGRDPADERLQGEHAMQPLRGLRIQLSVADDSPRPRANQ